VIDEPLFGEARRSPSAPGTSPQWGRSHAPRGAAVAWPLAARTPAVVTGAHRFFFLTPSHVPEAGIDAFRDGLRKLYGRARPARLTTLS